MKNFFKDPAGLRLMLDGLLILSVFLLPWWCVFVVGAALLLLTDAYEVILIGLLWDVLYKAPSEIFFGIQYILTVVFVVCALLGLLLRSIVRVR